MNINNKDKVSVLEEVSLEDRFCQFMGIDPQDELMPTEMGHTFELFSLYDNSKYEVHTYSNIEQIISVK
jgi:hypothetical protein